ncbi:MAG: glycosyltransferase family 39 protein [Candidatus Hydrogenedentes bacterium]|nr:glycosyltransferase family 39 protein [Candidatus Hydrogenedentota bacterium]
MPKQKAITVTPDARIGRLCLVVLCAVILIIGLVRLRLAGAPLERDEGEYAYAGQLMLQGVLPFVEMYNMKMPGIYAAYAVVLAVFGQSAVGVHLGLLLVNFASIVMLYFLARRYFSTQFAVIASGTFGLMSLSSGVLGAFAHATQFVVCFGLAAFLVLMQPGRPVRWPAGFASGLLFGLAFMMKQHAAPFIVVAGVYLLWQLNRNKEASISSRVATAILFGAGVFIPFLISCAALWGAGVFDRFWFWTFEYAGAYVSKNTAATIPENLGYAFQSMVPPVFLMTLLALCGLFAMWKFKSKAAFIVSLLVAGAIAVSPGFYYRTHYFVLVLPLAGILVAFGADWASQRLPRTMKAGALAPLIIAAIAWGQYLFSDRAYLFTQTPVEVSRAIYGANPFPESVQIGQYLRENTEPEDRIAIIGSEPQLCFYSQRRSASGFAYVYALMEDQPFASQMQKQMIEEIENGNPRYAVIIAVSTSWLGHPDSDRTIMEWARKYELEKCERVCLIDITPIGAIYHWNEDQKGRNPQSNAWVGIYKVRDWKPAVAESSVDVSALR